MQKRYNYRLNIIVFVILSVVICSGLLLGACGSTTSVTGTILEKTGEPFAGKIIVLVPLLPGDKVTIMASRAGGLMEIQVPLVDLSEEMNMGDWIKFETQGRKTRWSDTTDDQGNFTIRSVTPGEYILCWMVGGSLIRIGTTDGYIRIPAQEGQQNDHGTITLLGWDESITEHEAQR